MVYGLETFIRIKDNQGEPLVEPVYNIFQSFQMVNLLATLGENPLIRYYQPHHHPPLGALSQSTTPGSIHSPTSASSVGAHAAPTPVPGSSSQRWKSALGGGGKLETFGGEQVCRRLAVQIQSDLDQYKEVNPEFAVSFFFWFEGRCWRDDCFFGSVWYGS